MRHSFAVDHEIHERHERFCGMDIVYKEESYAIMGACFEVYKEMGSGFVEPVYQECLEYELTARGIPFRRKARLLLCYKGHRLSKKYIPDFICYEKIILEIKALSQLAERHRSQVHNYLKGVGLKLG